MPLTSTGMGQFTTIFNAIGTTLTTAFSGNVNTFSTHSSPTASLYVDYTNGSETSVEVRVELWDPENGWFVVPFNQSGGASAGAVDLTMTVDSTKRWGIRRIARFEQQMRISAKRVGSANGTTSLTVQVQLGASGYPIAGNEV